MITLPIAAKISIGMFQGWILLEIAMKINLGIRMHKRDAESGHPSFGENHNQIEEVNKEDFEKT